MVENIPPAGFYSENVPIIDGKKQIYDMSIKVTGQLSQWKSPELDIFFKQKPDKVFKAIIDTGAYDSHIRLDLVSELGIKMPDSHARSEHPNYGIVQSPCFQLSFHFAGFDQHVLEEKFCLMVSHYQYPIILGSDFLSRCKSFHYYGSQERFELYI